MRYEIRRIALGPTLRLVSYIAGAITLLPAMCLAGLVVQGIARASRVFSNLRQFEVRFPGTQTGPAPHLPPLPVNLVEQLGLGRADQMIQTLAGQLPLIFVLFSLLIVLAVTLTAAFAVLLFGLGYNLIAPRVGGLTVDLQVANDEG